MGEENPTYASMKLLRDLIHLRGFDFLEHDNGKHFLHLKD